MITKRRARVRRVMIRIRKVIGDHHLMIVGRIKIMKKMMIIQRMMDHLMIV